LEMPAMTFGKRVWLVQSYPLCLVTGMKNHGDAWKRAVL
jgi:hypothetical protein